MHITLIVVLAPSFCQSVMLLVSISNVACSYTFMLASAKSTFAPSAKLICYCYIISFMLLVIVFLICQQYALNLVITTNSNSTICNVLK